MGVVASQHDTRLRRSRRRAGTALAAYGVSGLVVVALGLALVSGLLDGDRGPFGLDVQRRAIVKLLETTERTLEDAETAARDANRSMSATSTATGDGSRFASEMATTLRTLASSLRFSLLGSQPFVGAADQFDGVAQQADRVATDLEGAASSMRLSSDDLASIADDLAAMRRDVAQLRADAGTAFDIGPWRILIAGLLLWLALPAAVSLWLGLRWWRPRWLTRPRDRRPDPR
jgi:hypothetical protein